MTSAEKITPHDSKRRYIFFPVHTSHHNITLTMSDPMKSKSELLNTLKKLSFTSKEETPTIENDIFSTLSYFKSLVNNESKTPSTPSPSSPYVLFYDDNEITKYFKKLLLESMTAQGSATLDEIRLLSHEIFTLILENSAIADVLTTKSTINDTNDTNGYTNDTNGKTLCALISLSVGELRIELGRILSSNRDNRDVKCRRRQILIIWYCSRIVQSTMSILIQLLEDKTATQSAWNTLSMDTIINIRKLLDDAHDSMFQYLAQCSQCSYQRNQRNQLIAILCIQCVGAWLSESSIDDLTTSHKMVYDATCNSINFCHKITCEGEDEGDDTYDTDTDTSMIVIVATLSSEPLEYLLPALVHISSQEKQKKKNNLLHRLSKEFPLQILIPYLNRVLETIKSNDESSCDHVKSLIWVFILLRKFKKSYKSMNYNNYNIRDTIIQSVTILSTRLHQIITSNQSNSNKIINYSNSLRYAIQSWYLFHPLHHPQEYEIIKALQLFEKLILNQLLDGQALLLSNVILDYKKYRELSLQYESYYELDLFMLQFESFVYTNAK